MVLRAAVAASPVLVALGAPPAVSETAAPERVVGRDGQRIQSVAVVYDRARTVSRAPRPSAA